MSLFGEITLGRESLNAASDHARCVSLNHAVLRVLPQAVVELESIGTHPTFVDSIPLNRGERMMLKDGQRIALERSCTEAVTFILELNREVYLAELTQTFARHVLSASAPLTQLDSVFVNFFGREFSSATEASREVVQACSQYLAFLHVRNAAGRFEMECKQFLQRVRVASDDVLAASADAGDASTEDEDNGTSKSDAEAGGELDGSAVDAEAAAPVSAKRPRSESPTQATETVRPDFDAWLARHQSEQKLTLDEVQRRVVSLACRDGRNVFYTGSGGVGKSLVTRTIVSYLEEADEKFEETVAVCASTGIASTHIGGTTIHSALGFGVCGHYSDFKRMWGRKEQLRKLKRLVLDEVSMLAGELFDRLDHMMRRIRVQPDKAFGGVQLIVCGDFFQLPPIPDTVPQQTWPLLLEPLLEQEKRACFWQHIKKCPHTMPHDECEGCERQEVFCNRGFAFQSSWWWDADFVFTEFARVYRQSEVQMVQVLNAIRQGNVTAEQVSWLNSQCCAPIAAKRSIQLAPKKAEAADRNDKEIEELVQRGARKWIWMARDRASAFEGSLADVSTTANSGFGHMFFAKDCPAEKRVTLVEGARVMLLTNLDLEAKGQEKLVNGSLGTLSTIAKESEALEAVELELEELEKRIKALLEKTEEPDRSERSRSLLMDRITMLRELKRNLRAWVANEERGTIADGRVGGCWQGAWKLPKVEFDNGRTVIVLPSILQNEVVGQGKCERLQIPLKVAWAVTIHKSQGMTLNAASVKVAGSFEKGMAYVALSRVSSLAGLRLRCVCINLDCHGCDGCRCELQPEHVTANEDVARFYTSSRAFSAATAQLADELTRSGADSEAQLLRGLGPRGVSQMVSHLLAGSRGEVVRALAAAAHDAASALNLDTAAADTWRNIAPEKSRYQAETT